MTASKIRDLARLKDAAVAAEEYDEAKRLKLCIERLKVRARACQGVAAAAVCARTAGVV